MVIRDNSAESGLSKPGALAPCPRGGLWTGGPLLFLGPSYNSSDPWGRVLSQPQETCHMWPIRGMEFGEFQATGSFLEDLSVNKSAQREALTQGDNEEKESWDKYRERETVNRAVTDANGTREGQDTGLS